VNWQRALLLTGIGLFGLGALGLAAPGVLGLDLGQPVLALVAVLALVQAARLVQSRRRLEGSEAALPDREELYAVPSPGDRFREALSQFRRRPRASYRGSSRADLAAVAVAVLTRYTGCSEAEAQRRLDDGSWTDDPYARAFLSGDHDLSVPTALRLRTVLGRESLYRRCLRRTVDEIARVAGVPVGTGDSDGEAAPQSRTRPSASADGLVARRETGHWYGISAVVLAGVGAGVLLEQPAVLLVGVVGLWYAAYARSHDVTGAALSVERSLSTNRPEPGETVTVTVTVRNDGEELLTDLRLVDGVPDALAVTQGSPRLGTALRPGGAVEFSYAVTARRGVHAFEPLVAAVRNAPGTVEHERVVAPERPTELVCTPLLEALPLPLPLRTASTPYAGVETTASSGDGVEFYSTRLYRPGDARSRIDWNRRARTGELSTLVFREERAASVVLLVDVDESAYVAPESGEHAVDRSVEAAGQAFATLETAGHFVGVGALGRAECWLAPGAGETHRARARELLATHPALASVPPEEPENPLRARRLLRSRLPANAQVVVFSPLGRPSVVRTIRGLEAAGYPVTVVSPDPTADGTPGRRLARVGRRLHVTDLRGDGIPVLEWAWDEPFATAVAAFAEQRRQP